MIESRLNDYPTTSTGLMRANSGLINYACAHFLCGLRDSFRFLDHSTDTIQGRYYNNRAKREREEARNWFRAVGDGCDSGGIGFGFVWEVMMIGDRVHSDVLSFLKQAEELWSKADADPRFSRKISKMIQAEITGYMKGLRARHRRCVEDLTYGPVRDFVQHDQPDAREDWCILPDSDPY